MLTAACFVALVTIVNAAETTRIKTVFEGHFVYQDVTKDLDSNTMLIAVDAVEDIADFRSTVNLHDFNTGYVAMKTIAERVCLLKPLDEGMADHISSKEVKDVNGEKVLAKVKKIMYWNRDPHVMDYGEVKEKAGEILADFCRDYKTYLLTPKELDPDDVALFSRQHLDVAKRVGRPRYPIGRARVKRCWFLCGGCRRCLNYVDVFEGDVVDIGD